MSNFRRLAKTAFAEPFQPFRIRLTNGKVYEISHPDMIGIGHSRFIIDPFWSDDEEFAELPKQEIALDLIESIEPLEPAGKDDSSRS